MDMEVGNESLDTAEKESEFIHDLIEEMAADRSKIGENLSHLPTDMAARLVSEEFLEDCATKFREVDVDKNGVLTPDELFPVVETLLGFSSWSLTLEHCARFAEVFVGALCVSLQVGLT